MGTYNYTIECAFLPLSRLSHRADPVVLAANDLYYEDDEGTRYIYNLGDMAWILTSTALVWIMIPGVGFFYSGLLRRKNALSMLWAAMVCLAVVSFQWFFWGYSLAFAEDASAYIGTLKHFALQGVLAEPSPGSSRIPSILFCVYQLMFAAITYAPPLPLLHQ